MKKTNLKLPLRREAIRTLTERDMTIAHGGADNTDAHTDGCYPTKSCPDPQ